MTGNRKIPVLCLFYVLSCLVSCGKVGDPQPPFIRIPVPVEDLNAAQAGSTVVLTWTNPARNIDGSAATDLARVHIQSGERAIATINVTEPGKPQSYDVPMASGISSAFHVVVETSRGKMSKNSNVVSITAVDVPGRIADLHAVVDQHRITLTWSKPLDHAELADMYVVTRMDIPAEPETVSDTHYADSRYPKVTRVTYQVTAIRRIDSRTVTGLPSEPYAVSVEDKTPPQTPTGLDVIQSDGTGYLTWEANSEGDLVGYRVFRSDSAVGDFKLVSPGVIVRNTFVDPNYKPGSYYSVSAVDEYMNESTRSAAVHGP